MSSARPVSDLCLSPSSSVAPFRIEKNAIESIDNLSSCNYNGYNEKEKKACALTHVFLLQFTF